MCSATEQSWSPLESVTANWRVLFDAVFDNDDVGLLDVWHTLLWE